MARGTDIGQLASPPPLPSGPEEIRILARLRSRLLRNHLRDVWTTNRLRAVIIAALTAVLWSLIFSLFLGGFRELRSTITHAGTLALTVHAVFNVFFLSLFVMIILSSAILYFSNAYRGREVNLLLTLPLRVRRFVLLKFEEALLLGGWGFFLLGSPVLLAYGIAMRARWYYFVLLPPFMLAFVSIAVALGTMLCLVCLRVLPRQRLRAVWVLGAGLILVFASVAYSMFREVTQAEAFTLEWLHGVLARLRYSEQRWLPSWWLSSGLIEASQPTAEWSRSLRETCGFFSLLASSAMAGMLATGWLGDRLFLSGYSELADLGGEGGVSRVRRSSWALPRIPGLRREITLLVWKDFRIFRRDLVQWSQVAVFFGLLVFYFLNIRRLRYGAQFATWLVVISSLNVAVVGLLLATFTTRFVYPLISLEGRRFWILGTSPISRRDVVWSKFIFAVGLSLIPCGVLVLLSDLMLGVQDLDRLLLITHQLASAANCLGLSALSVGLGARFPHLRASSAAKIATGFGGTLTLVLSIVLIGAVTAASSIPVYWWMSRQFGGGDILMSSWPPLSVWLGCLGTALLGLGTTFAAIRAGLRSFEAFEP